MNYKNNSILFVLNSGFNEKIKRLALTEMRNFWDTELIDVYSSKINDVNWYNWENTKSVYFQLLVLENIYISRIKLKSSDFSLRPNISNLAKVCSEFGRYFDLPDLQDYDDKKQVNFFLDKLSQLIIDDVSKTVNYNNKY